jgi:hybrid cluster-associated redox disulfide protein
VFYGELVNDTKYDRSTLAAMNIEALLRQWPETAAVFQRHRMACLSCAVAPFYAVEEAITIYQLAEDAFLDELLAVIDKSMATER